MIDKKDSGDSVMRDFLQSGIEFKWPRDLGECSGNHCDLRLDIKGIPLQWKKKISDKKASIDVYEALPDFNFRKPFVVKTIRDSNSQKMTANEVENMRGLRHPHITALLGTFTYQARLSILIFPAACCDLQQFMNRMSEGTSTPDSITSNSEQLYSSDGTSSGQSGHHGVRSDSWSVMLPIERRIEMLRGYFGCLSRALQYLHEQGIRHKDIKPANILIDESESVILTDFGISRRFPKDEPHVTNNEWNFTRKYASPEIMKHRKMPRDDASDVFSLGCVFLEMATLLLENTLTGLSAHYSIPINDSADEAYYRNLEKVHEWIDQLRVSRNFRPVLEHWEPGNDAERVSQEFSPTFDNRLTAALVDIRKMLDEVPENRPPSRTLWHRFKDISPKPCRDCDPRSHEMWKPSARQQKAAETGLSNRQSLHTDENADQVPMSPSPRPHFPDENLGAINPQDIQESVPTLSTPTIQDTIAKTPFGDMRPAKPTSPHQPQTQNTATNTLPLPRDSSSRESRPSETNQRRFARHEMLVRIPEKDMPRPEMPIIVYDMSKETAFQTDCAWLKDALKGADCTHGGFVP